VQTVALLRVAEPFSIIKVLAAAKPALPWRAEPLLSRQHWRGIVGRRGDVAFLLDIAAADIERSPGGMVGGGHSFSWRSSYLRSDAC